MEKKVKLLFCITFEKITNICYGIIKILPFLCKDLSSSSENEKNISIESVLHLYFLKFQDGIYLSIISFGNHE